ncbi:dixin-A-like [Uloborus diversus]|uniref:dixin-A-like n=1 Tax=Uloborus diversus TaxID=327109 RepID=UPI002409CC85|nr:dixin-A-like [Uloborus diversus]
MQENSFISILVEKLNRLKRDQEVREALSEFLEEFRIFRQKQQSKLSTHAKKKIHTSTSELQNCRSNKRKPIRGKHHKLSQKVAFHNRLPTIHEATSRHPELWKKEEFNLNETTIVGYCFAGNPVPYITKVHGKNITLQQFKNLFNRKGCFRYFFKKYNNEFGTQIVFEEITNDDEYVPLWDGKIFALVEEVEDWKLFLI